MQEEDLLEGDDDEYEEVYFLSPDGQYLCEDQGISIEVVETDEIDSYETESEQNQSGKGQYQNSLDKPKLGRKTKYGMTREDRKMMYNTNKPYINTKGKEVGPKTFDEDFVCTCKKRCTDAVKLEDRKRLFNQFWNIGSFSARCLLLQQHIKEYPKKRTYTKQKSRRQNSRKYYINDVEICKVAFLKTLQIHSNRIDVALQKRSEDVIMDNRGSKSGGWNRCSEEQIDSVVEHINKFLVYISQCRKKQSETKQFKSSELNLKRMYNMYKESCTNIIPVSHSTYKLIFYKHFHRRVKSPKKLLAKCVQNQTLLDSVEMTQEHHIEGQSQTHCDVSNEIELQPEELDEENTSVETFLFNVETEVLVGNDEDDTYSISN